MTDASANDNQPAREQNIAAILSFFESGIETNPGKLGIELEHTIVKQKDWSPVSYSEVHGIRWVLEQLKEEYPSATYDSEGDLLGVMRQGEAVTIEPAAQLELSAGPFSSLHDAEKCFSAFEDKLEQIVKPVGAEVVTFGYHPSTKAQDLELIPKRRYKFMNLYLGNISNYGPYMMRGTASTQVSIDYSSTDDCLRKLKLAYALVPLFSLISDNSPFFEGQIRPHELMRTEVWEHCDPARCGLIPGIMSDDFTLRTYAEYILDTPAILVPCKRHEWCYTEKTFGDIYSHQAMDQADVEHAVSMLFNDVRLKTYIEIRPADAMPIPYVLAYTAFIRGLFYSEDSLEKLDRLFASVKDNDIVKAQTALMTDGYRAKVYGRPASELVDELMDIAQAGLSVEEKHFLTPLKELAEQRETLASLFLQKHEGVSDELFSDQETLELPHGFIAQMR